MCCVEIGGSRRGRREGKAAPEWENGSIREGASGGLGGRGGRTVGRVGGRGWWGERLRARGRGERWGAGRRRGGRGTGRRMAGDVLGGCGVTLGKVLREEKVMIFCGRAGRGFISPAESG